MRKNKYIQFVGIFTASLLLASPAAAQPANLVVDFENTPLFSEANFLPGNELTRFAKVTNNTADPQQIQVEAINVVDPDSFGDILEIKVTEGAAVLYSDTLSTFFAAGQVPLSVLAGNATQTQYDFTVGFAETANNSYQEKSVGFDLLIGFQGVEDAIESSEEDIASTTGSGEGSGSLGNTSSPPGLLILDETVQVLDITETSVTIEWGTSYSATSQVIFAAQGEPFALNLQAPNYGYPQAFPNPENVTKVILHSVTIPGLQPGSTYFFRAVSHASPATISRSYTFQTAGNPIEIGQADGELLGDNSKDSNSVIHSGTENNVPSIGSITQLSDLEEKLKTNSSELIKTHDIENTSTLALLNERGTENVGGFFAAAGILRGFGIFGLLFAVVGIFILFVLSRKQRSEEK